jgi:plasmid segregation protein ParM
MTDKTNEIIVKRNSPDLGNGETKAKIDQFALKAPSAIAVLRNQDIPKNETFRSKAEEEVYMKDFLSHLDVQIQSKALSELTTRMFVGERAVASHLKVRAFNVDSPFGKAKVDLPLVLNMTFVAAKVVMDEYERTNEVPYNLKVIVKNTVVALPIAEEKDDDIVTNYINRYTQNEHFVTFNNFDRLVRVELVFENVEVLAEGEVAQYAIMDASKDLMTSIQKEITKNYPTSKITAEIATKAKDVLGIDIGEGTTDFPVITGGELNREASHNIKYGYGQVLNEARRALAGPKYNKQFNNRQALSHFLSQEVTPLNENDMAEVQDVVDEQLNEFAKRIVDEAMGTMASANMTTRVIYVYGGGSIGLKPYLQKPLMEMSAQISKDLLVVFIDSQNAQYMNQDGLSVAVRYMEQAQEEA